MPDTQNPFAAFSSEDQADIRKQLAALASSGKLNPKQKVSVERALGQYLAPKDEKAQPPKPPSMMAKIEAAGESVVPMLKAFTPWFQKSAKTSPLTTATKVASNDKFGSFGEFMRAQAAKRPQDDALGAVVDAGVIAGDLAEVLTTPENAAILTGMGMLESGSLAKRLIDFGFSTSMAKAAADQYVEGYKHYRAGDKREARRQWGGAAVQTLFSVLSGKSAVEKVGKGEMVSPPKPPDAKAETKAATPPAPPVEGKPAAMRPSSSGATPEQLNWFASRLRNGTFDYDHAESQFEGHHTGKILDDLQARGLIERVEPTGRGKKAKGGGWKITGEGERVKRAGGLMDEMPQDPASTLKKRTQDGLGRPLDQPPAPPQGPITEDDFDLPEDSHTETPQVVGGASAAAEAGVPPAGEGQVLQPPASEPQVAQQIIQEVAPKVRMMRPSEGKLDPQRMQFRVKPRESGVTEAKKIDPDLMGILYAWQDPATGEYIWVNGHHRVTKARELGYDEPTPTRIIDAPTAESARAKGALINIAEGHADPLDAAIFFREHNLSPEQADANGLSMSGPLTRDGMALAGLSEATWDKMVHGEIKESDAIAIGKATSDKGVQDSLLEGIQKQRAKGKRLSAADVEEYARLNAGETVSETQQGLFGEETTSRSTAWELGRLSNRILKQLGKDKRLFNLIADTDAAKEIQARTKSIIDTEKSGTIAAESKVAVAAYRKLSDRGGEVHELLREGARRIAEGEDESTVTADIYGRVQRAIGGLFGRETADSGAASQDSGVPKPPPATDSAGNGSAGNGEEAEGGGTDSLFVEDAPPGPGAQNRAAKLVQQGMVQPRETGTSHIEDLTNSLKAMGRASDQVRESIAQKVDRVRKGVADLFHGSPDENEQKAASFWQAVKEIGGHSWEWWSKSGLESSDLKEATKDWQFQDQYLADRLQKFVDGIKKSIPNRERRVAITNWIQADGNREVLAQRAAKSKPKYRKGYEDALTLNADEIVVANNIRNFQDAELQENLQTGILDHGRENYVQQIWKKIRNPQRFFSSTANSSALAPNPSYAKKSVFPSYFEGEQAGYKPRNKDIAYLISNHHAEFSKALSARAYIASLMEGKASDGRPLAVLGGTAQAEGGGQMAEKFFVRPNANPEMAGDYRDVNHPALRGWKSVATSEDGNRVIMQGNMKIHPEAYSMVHNNLSPSAFRSEVQLGPIRFRPGTAVLRLSSEFKQALTANWLAAIPGMTHAPGFHQFTEAQHAAMHLTFAPVKEIDFNHLDQAGLIRNGVIAAHFDGEYEFSDGLGANGGLVTQLPWIGPRMQENAHYLFHDYIPRLKMGMALKALERNRERYRGQLSETQIHELTARQANAAFGELNYKLLGRNKTTQDVFRCVALAPDFLEARARFVGQAATPYGREQLTALARGAAALYLGSRILNKWLDDDYHWDRPFSVVYKTREYETRTVMGDVGTLVTQPKMFLRNRLNPYLVKGPFEFLYGRNDRGEKVSASEQFGDYARSVIPIPAQGWFNRQSETRDQKIVKSVFASIGVNERTYRSNAENLAHKYAQENPHRKMFYGTESPLVRSLFFAAYEGSLDVGRADKALSEGKISGGDYSRMMRYNSQPQLERDWQHVPEEKKQEVIEKMTAKEKQMLGVQ